MNYLDKKVTEFSLRPGPRYFNQGQYSGEQFYLECLKPWFEEALSKNLGLRVILDGTDGYLSSFLDEAFGRLVFDYSAEKVKNMLVITSHQEPQWIANLNSKTFPAWQVRRDNKQFPKITYQPA